MRVYFVSRIGQISLYLGNKNHFQKLLLKTFSVALDII